MWKSNVIKNNKLLNTKEWQQKQALTYKLFHCHSKKISLFKFLSEGNQVLEFITIAQDDSINVVT